MNFLAKILLAQNHTHLQIFSTFAMYKCVLENKMIASNDGDESVSSSKQLQNQMCETTSIV